MRNAPSSMRYLREFAASAVYMRNSLSSCIFPTSDFCYSSILFFTQQEKERIITLIQTGVESGAKLVLDGRNIVVSSFMLSSMILTVFLISFCSNL